jgi:hypothetical protein
MGRELRRATGAGNGTVRRAIDTRAAELGFFRMAPPPPRWWFALLLAVSFGSPFVARAAGTMWGSFGMFQRVERYHVDITRRTAHGDEPVPLSSLAPHLSRDARRLILPAAGQAYGTDQIELVEGGLGDLGELVCQLHPGSTSILLRLTRSTAQNEALHQGEREVRCDAR